ncbi:MULTISPECIES: hypothetical protein [Clostridium]|uniref:WXG100 family type VII secretion target n=1 Tax=Clostridium cibarium TaxID=2762247 RepID=A0ABR8PPT8_9CLOT|nr:MULTISPECIES: hypothetical protein [Clostridium]MBD7910196.1 hypothetical protein [Clostridium cibarium]
MDANYSAINSETTNISTYIETLNSIKLKVTTLGEDINSNWKGTEVGYLNEALCLITNEITQLNRMLNTLSDEILEAADEIE